MIYVYQIDDVFSSEDGSRTTRCRKLRGDYFGKV